jgi:hypothetical protein
LDTLPAGFSEPHNDSGRGQFNFSEIAGNSTAVAISISYYPENRDVIDGISKLGIQLGVDMASNILKEFWPDLKRRRLATDLPERVLKA